MDDASISISTDDPITTSIHLFNWHSPYKGMSVEKMIKDMRRVLCCLCERQGRQEAAVMWSGPENQVWLSGIIFKSILKLQPTIALITTANQIQIGF